MSRTHSQCSHRNGKQSFQDGELEEMQILVFTLPVCTYYVSAELVSQKCKGLSSNIYIYIVSLGHQPREKVFYFLIYVQNYAENMVYSW